MPFNKKEYDEKNKEHIKAYQKAYDKIYNEKNKEHIKERNKEYHENNKEQIKEQKKEYYKNNKEQRKEYDKTPRGIKSNRISQWKSRGIISIPKNQNITIQIIIY